MANLNLKMIAQFQDKASKGLQKLSGNLDKVKQKADKAAKATSRVGGGGGSGGGRSGGGGGSDGGSGAADVLAGGFVAKKGFDMFGTGPVAAVATIGALTASIGLAGKKFETMRATLSSVVPQSVATADAFALIQKITTQLPTNIDQTAAAFIKMLALGITPTEERMLSFGNTAAAMGKDIQQFVEAVADAATNEFERLKEFGIKARQEGDKVTFTFRGASTTVKKDAASIVGYLESIGNTQFAGAAAKQMDTVEGAISNLGVAWGEFVDFMFQSGFGTVMKDFIELVTRFVGSFKTGIIEMRVAAVQLFAVFDRIAEDARYVGDAIKAMWSEDTLDDVIARHKKQVELINENKEATIEYIRSLKDQTAAADKANTALKNYEKTQKSVVISMKGMTVEGHKLKSIDEFMGDLANSFSDTEREIENAWAAQEMLNDMFQEGVISSEEFLHSMEAVNSMLMDDTEETTEQVAGFWQQAANNMQDTFGNVFFDWMQGNMVDLADSFKRMIDRMVAELLASKLLNFLVGDFGKTGNVGGAIGDLFRAEGGPINAGQPYIVGEKGPELIVPNSSGSVIANKNLGGGMGSNVSINIQALDGADAMRVMEQNKREITELVLGTSAAYNMGTI